MGKTCSQVWRGSRRITEAASAHTSPWFPSLKPRLWVYSPQHDSMFFMGLMCPKSVTCKLQRIIAFLPRSHRRSFADTCFTLHQKPVLYTFEDKDLEINAQMCVHMNFLFDVLSCWFIFIHKLTPQTLYKVENSTHAYTTCVVRLSACVYV